MRVRTFLGVLFGLAAIGVLLFLSHQNREVLAQPFALGSLATIPVHTALVAAFVLGFLPPALSLLLGTIRQELEARERRARQREEDSLAAAFRRGVDCQFDGQMVRAASELGIAAQGRPEDFPVLLRHGEVLRQAGRFDEAIEAHHRLSVLYPSNVTPLYQLAEDYEAKGETEVAREIRNRILRDFAGFGLAVLVRRRNAALASGQLEVAAELQGQVEDLRGATPVSAEEGRVALGLEYQRGVVELEGERVEPAIARFRAVLAREPRFLPAAIMLGEAELVREDEPAALERWIEGYEQTGSPVFLQRIEDHFIEGGEPVRAIETVRRLIARAKNDLLPRFFLGRLYYRLEMHEEALRVLAGIADRVGGSPTYHYLLARIHERHGDVGKALAAYQTSSHQSGVPQNEYRCRLCRSVHPEWRDRCETCGAWNSIELDFEEENIPPALLGVLETPVWGVPTGWDPGDLPPTGETLLRGAVP
jgi:tetratricopeptide (TPR) repeat protein